MRLVWGCFCDSELKQAHLWWGGCLDVTLQECKSPHLHVQFEHKGCLPLSPALADLLPKHSAADGGCRQHRRKGLFVTRWLRAGSVRVCDDQDMGEDSFVVSRFMPQPHTALSPSGGPHGSVAFCQGERPG